MEEPGCKESDTTECTHTLARAHAHTHIHTHTWGLNGSLHVKLLEQCQIHRKCLHMHSISTAVFLRLVFLKGKACPLCAQCVWLNLWCSCVWTHPWSPLSLLSFRSDGGCSLSRTNLVSLYTSDMPGDKLHQVPPASWTPPWSWKVGVCVCVCVCVCVFYDEDRMGVWHYLSCSQFQRVHFEWWVISIREDIFRQEMTLRHMGRFSLKLS